VSDQHLFITPGTPTTHRIDLRLQGEDYGAGVASRALPSSDSDGPREVRDCINNYPLKICYQWLGDALRADSVASTLFGTLGVVADNTRANAFKHSYAVSLFVRTMITQFGDDGPPHWGYDYARLHELKDRESSNPDKRHSSFMDTNNNLVALNYTTDHPTRNMAQLCTTIRSKAKNARYVKFPEGADTVDVPPNNLRTRLIYIRAYDPDVDGSGNPIDGGFFPESKPCKYALQRFAEH
jgi:hypothetical protein